LVAVDGLGNPLRLLLAPGQRHESTKAQALVEGFAAQYFIADTAFDSDRFRAYLSEQNSRAVIPSHPSRSKSIKHDTEIYKERHLVECFFNKIKHFRRVATRYDKTELAFLAFVTIASFMVWLR
jgi:putative transposase